MTLVAAKFLQQYRAVADVRLARVLERQEVALGALPFDTARYYAHLTEYVLRSGKRLRGALVLLGHEAAGGDPARALDASLAFELVHAYFLAFDDIMDRDELRRGGKALHVLTREEAMRAGARDPEHRGLSVALLLGMLAQALGVELLAGSPFADDVKGRALAYFNEVTAGVTVGQLLDVLAVDAPAASPADVAEIHRRKTGQYTTEGPLLLGALLAGAGPDVVAKLTAYARPLGEAFQLVDDLLGVVGASETTGKPASSDLREGKRSSVIEAAVGASGPASDELAALVGRPLDAQEAARARALIVASGAPDEVLERARRLADEAVASLAGLPAEPAGVLESVARLVVERRS